MKNCLLLVLFLAVILLLSGCITAGIAKPDVPMKEQCVVDTSGILTINGSVTYGEIDIYNWGEEMKAIVPAGNNRLRITKRQSYLMSTSETANSTVRTYNIAWEK